MTRPQYSSWCTVEGMRSLVDMPLGGDASAESVGEASAGAAQLVHDAYVTRLPAAEALAERLLYEIHVGSLYGGPAHPLASLVWRTLLRGHLSVTLEKYRVPPLDPKELASRMQEAVEELGAWNHPLVAAMTALAARPAFGVWCKNWYGSCTGYTFQLTAIAQRLAPESELGVRTASIFRNLADELADQVSHTPHHTLRYRILERAGVSYDVRKGADDRDLIAESYALHNYRTAVTTLTTPMYALGTVYGVEANWVLETPRLAERLRAAGYDSRTVESFDVHATLDKTHAQEWLEMVVAMPMTPQQAADTLTGTIAGLQVRRRMYDALHALFSRGEARASA